MAKTFQDLLNEGQAKVLGIVSIVPMDDWNTDTQYQKLNLVRHNGAAYLAKGGSKNVEPGAAADWQNSWMLVYLDGILSPDGTYPNLTAGRVMHALAWGNKNYDGSSTQTITAADLGLADVYKPQGSIAFASLPATPNESNYGYVWNITNDFTTDSRFIEGAGKKYSAGTNVGVIEQDSAYYYDIFGAFVDLSNYATVEALNTDIANIKNGTTVVGAAGSVTATTLTSSDDLNDLKGAEHWGKIYYWSGGNNPKNSPPNASGGAVKIIRAGVHSTMQRGYSSSSSPSSSLPTSTQRSYNGSTWTNWEELMTSDGSYPTAKVGALALSAAVGSSAKPVYFSAGGVPVACGDELDVSVTGGAGHLQHQGISSVSSSTIGWYKVGTTSASKIVSGNGSVSVIFLVNGVYQIENTATPTRSGLLELDVTKLNGNFAAFTISVLGGALDPEQFFGVLENDVVTLYWRNVSTYGKVDFTILTQQDETLGNWSDLFEFDIAFYGTSAPSGAVYAVNRNVAAKGITPAAGSNSDDVATTEWVNNALPHLYLHRITVTANGTVGAARFMWLSTSSAAYTLTSLCRLIYSNYSTNQGRIIPATGGWSDSTKYYMTTYFQVTSATTATVNGIARYISGNNLSYTSGWVDVESISDTVTQLF